jgi:hypothetical protein
VRRDSTRKATLRIPIHFIRGKTIKIGHLIYLALALFGSGSTVPAQESPSQTSTRMAAQNQPGPVGTAPGNFIVDAIPVLSPATIISITNDGSTSVMNCTVFACRLTVGSQIELGEVLAVATNCEGPHTTSAVPGNTASFLSPNCVASGGTRTRTPSDNGPLLSRSPMLSRARAMRCNSW